METTTATNDTKPIKVSWLISESTITVNFNGQTHMLSRTDAYASLLIKALKEKNFDAVPELVSAAKRIEKFSHGRFTVRDGDILIDGNVAPPVLGRKIKDFADNGLPYEPLVLFAQKLQRNSSARALKHLYEFLEKNNHPISPSGNFIAYKRINRDFTDIHSGTMDNSVGNIVSMPRNQVDEDPNRTCSTGLHCCAWGYLTSFPGDLIVEVEVDPADVVAIPVDYEQKKMRVSRYKVLGIVSEERLEPLRQTNQAASPEDDFDSDDDYECPDCGDEGCYECEER